MTRLDEFIVRMQAQRACIDEAAALTASQPGPVLELGLGNGRTYDHLRQRFSQRAVFVFDREVAAHPDCIPAPAFLRLGDFRVSLPAYLAEGQPASVFIHADIGSANRRASAQLAADLAPLWREILIPGGFLACDQRITLDGLLPLPLPAGLVADNYHFYCRAS